jgi:ribosome maturation factor RimP
MIHKETLQEIIASGLADTDSYPVDIRIKPGNVITVEIDGDTPITVDRCARLSKYIESRLDRDAEDYELTVGSAGIGQPLKTLRQYVKNTGNEVEILTKTGKKHVGVLKAADAETVTLSVTKQIKPANSPDAKKTETVEEILIFPHAEIKHTKNLIKFK